MTSACNFILSFPFVADGRQQPPAEVVDPALIEKANEIAAYLELSLEIRYTGFGLLEERLVNLMRQEGTLTHETREPRVADLSPAQR